MRDSLDLMETWKRADLEGQMLRQWSFLPPVAVADLPTTANHEVALAGAIFTTRTRIHGLSPSLTLRPFPEIQFYHPRALLARTQMPKYLKLGRQPRTKNCNRI